MKQVVAFHLLILVAFGIARPAAGGLRSGSQADLQLASDEDDSAALAAAAGGDSQDADDPVKEAAVPKSAPVALLTKVQGANVLEAVQSQQKAIEALESQQEALAAQQEALTAQEQKLETKEGEVDAILGQLRASGMKMADLPALAKKSSATITGKATPPPVLGAVSLAEGQVNMEMDVLRNRGKERFTRIMTLVNGIPFATLAVMVTSLILLGFVAVCMAVPKIGKLGVELPTKIATGVPGMLASGLSKMQMPSMKQRWESWGGRAPDEQQHPMPHPQARIPGGPR